jgi:Na+/H+ antiporter NhaC
MGASAFESERITMTRLDADVTLSTAQEPRLAGLLPVGVFLLLFIGSGVVLQDFYAMPAIVAFLAALIVAFCQAPRRSFSDKLEDAVRSMGDSNVMIMCLVFVLAGAFTGAADGAGCVDATVNFALSVLPGNIIIAGLFLVACFISLSMGTSVGTIAALAPIAVGIATKTSFSGAVCLAAVVSGAMFGDNLSMISDTTIAATRTQGCSMDAKFKENFKIALPAAIIAFVVFLIIGSGANYQVTGDLSYNLWQVLPYLAVLIVALLGVNVIAVLVGGCIFATVVGVCLGTIEPSAIFTTIGSGPDGDGGIFAMYDITVISIICAGIIGLVKANGGIDWILQKVRKHVKGPKGAQVGIAVLSSLVDISTANNTVAIVMAGPIARDIAKDYGLTPRRTASLLDIFTSVWQGIIPYGAQLLYASSGAAAAGLAVSPFEIVPYLAYPFLLAICALVYIAIWGNKHNVPVKADDQQEADADAQEEDESVK